MQNEVTNVVTAAANVVPPDLSANIQSRLIGLMDYLTETAKIVDSTAKEQIPLFIKDIIAWEFYSNLAWLVLGLTGLIIGLTLVVRFLWRIGFICKKLPEYGNGDYDYRHTAEKLRGYLLPPTIMTTVAPRLVILDYVKQAMNPYYRR